MNRFTGIGKSVVLSVGQEFHLKRGKDRIVYAGMPSGDVYSIVQRKAYGNQGYSWNLYFPKNRREIILDGVEVHIERVTPDELQLSVS